MPIVRGGDFVYGSPDAGDLDRSVRWIDRIRKVFQPQVRKHAGQDAPDDLHRPHPEKDSTTMPRSTARPPTTPIRMASPGRKIALQSTDLVRLLDSVRSESAREVERAFEGASTKKINAVRLPGCSRHGVTRAANGHDSNPIYRFFQFCVLLWSLGFGRERAQRLVDFMQELVDLLWPIHTGRADDGLFGVEDARSALAMLEAVRIAQAFTPRVIGALRRLAGAAAA